MNLANIPDVAFGTGGKTPHTSRGRDKHVVAVVILPDTIALGVYVVKTVFGQPAGMLAEVMGIDQPSPYEVVLCGASQRQVLPSGIDFGDLAPLDVARDADTVVVPGVVEPWRRATPRCWKRCVMPMKRGRGLCRPAAVPSFSARRACSTAARRQRIGCLPQSSAEPLLGYASISTGSTSMTAGYTLPRAGWLRWTWRYTFWRWTAGRSRPTI